MSDELLFTSDGVIRLLRDRITQRGDQGKLAREIGVSISFLGDVLAGNRNPGARVLGFLDLEECPVLYRKRRE